MRHFARTSWFLNILVALFLCVATSRASFAQGELWVAECPACAQHLGGKGVIGPFPTVGACNKAVLDERNLGFIFGGCHQVSPSSASQMRWLTPGAAVIGSTVVFGAGSGLAGTFWNNPQGQTFGYGGAGLGAGTFGFAALALNARQMSRPAVVFTSALDFAAIGAGTAQAVQFRQEWANPQAPAPNNKSIVIGAAFGAAAGTIIGLLLPHKTGNHDHVTKAAASDIMADLSPENRKRSIFLRKLQSTNERGSPVDAPLTNDIGNRSTYNYFKVIEQFRVEDEENRRYQPGNKTYCNIFVWDVTRAMGFEIPHWVADDRGNRHEMRVNQLAGWLNETGKKQGWTHVDARMAQQMANDGHPSIAIWENPNSSISGHIAVIRPGSVGDERGAAISQAGRLVLDASHIDTGFNDPDHEKRVQYWYHE